MILNLIKSERLFSLTLPQKVKGQYWLKDNDSRGNIRNLLSVEAIGKDWVAKSNKTVSILDGNGNPVKNTIIKPNGLYNLKIDNSNERVILFAEDMDASRITFTKYVVRASTMFSIGRTNDNNLCFENRFVSSKHAQLSYNGNVWSIIDRDSTNGTYVNGNRVSSRKLDPGDHVYIMGLRIIIGHSFFAVNNPDGLLKISSRSLVVYKPQPVDTKLGPIDLPEKEYFFRSPRFYREVEHAALKIDPPPAHQKADTVPLALMLGPSLTMGMTSLSTGILGLSNALSSGGNVMQAMPTLVMSGSMLLGTVLWPILTKRYEKKQSVINEKKRQDKYLAYLDSVRDDIRRKCKEQSDIINENIVPLGECAERAIKAKTNLWERSNGQSDFLRLRIGTGDLPLDAEVEVPEKKFTMDDDSLQDAMLSLGSEPRLLNDVPISLSLMNNASVGLYGQRELCCNMLKGLILQIIALHSYDEVKIALFTDETDIEQWRSLRFIQHLWNDDRSRRFFAANDEETKELSNFLESQLIRVEGEDEERSVTTGPFYVVISTNKASTEKCSVIQQLLKAGSGSNFGLILVADALKDLPKETDTVVAVDENKARMYSRKDHTGEGISFATERINDDILDDVSAALANIEIDLSTQRYMLPSMLTFLEMFGVSKIEHLNVLTRWKENNPTITLQTPIGVDSNGGPFYLDLHERTHGPHGLVAGMTGSGKSEFIITYILSLAVNYHPDEVAFILIDYKGGGLTGAFEDQDRGIKLPHLAGTITNLDGAAIKRSLVSIQSELRRRQAIFNEARRVANEGTMDIYKYQKLYRDKVVSEPVPHLFIISDEFAELKTQQPDFMQQLISAARIGRSLGVHLILATQKPSGVVDDQIWSNSKFRVCLKVQEKADSQDMIKCPDAAALTQTGRFYLQVGFNELFALGQSAWCGAEYIPTDSVEKTVDGSVQVIDDLGHVITSAKTAKKKVYTESKVKQIVAIVKYLSDLASEESISVRPLWLDPIPANIFVDELQRKYNVIEKGTNLNPLVGEYDDPFNQRQGPLFIPISNDGNCLVYGSTGNGKAMFLTTLIYSLIKNHTPEEVNIYIMDYGSETLKVFEKAPHVGGVILSTDTEKTINFIKMLKREAETRRSLFSAYGGDYQSYIKNSGNVIPNIVTVLNNYSGFYDLFEEYQDDYTVLTRDGVKYGIYFIVTASAANAVRYKTQQNFKTLLTMQLNDATDYSSIVGRTEGLIPSKFKGRGLISMGKVYEFQTALCTNDEDQQNFLRDFCEKLRENTKKVAAAIPVLPKFVTLESVYANTGNIGSIPVGINKKTLAVSTVNMGSRVLYPVISQELAEAVPFVEELMKVLKATTKTILVDAEQAVSEETAESAVTNGFESFVDKLFSEMVARNNAYKDAGMDLSVLADREEIIYVIVGFKRFHDKLSDQGKDKLHALLEKAEPYYKIHFILVDTAQQLGSFAYDTWFKRQISGADGIYIGDGVTDQYVLKMNNITKAMYQELEKDFGYMVSRNKPALIKLLTSRTEEEG